MPKTQPIVKVAGILAVTIMVSVNLFMGNDGLLLAGGIGAVAGIAGYSLGKKEES